MELEFIYNLCYLHKAHTYTVMNCTAIKIVQCQLYEQTFSVETTYHCRVLKCQLFFMSFPASLTYAVIKLLISSELSPSLRKLGLSAFDIECD